MTNADTHQFIDHETRNPDDWGGDGAPTAPKTLINKTGKVDMNAYITWLKNHGYGRSA